MPSARLLLLFFGSGACALIYQVVWMRALSLTMSVTVYAVTTVLCAFMAGLGLGAAFAGRVADRLERPLLVFGLAEIGIGLAGLLMPRLLFGLAPVEVWLADQFASSGLGVGVGRFLVASAILLVPCTLMGMTLPLLSRAVVESEEFVGRGAGGLYATNTLGAVAGCIVAGFALIPHLGLQQTSAVAAGINFFIGALAVGLGRRRSSSDERVGVPEALPREPARLAPRVVAIAFGISGSTALGYEVLWTRALEQFTHNSTYAYTAMLATFLFGIGVGSAVSARLADRTRRPVAWFGAVEIGIGISVIGALIVYMQLLHWIPATAEALGGLGSWGRAVALIFGVSGITLLVTTFLFGATFPFVVRAVVESVEFVGRRVALAYAVNTLGSIAGAVGVGFGLLPWLGLRGTFVVLISLNLLLGCALVLVAAPRALAALAGSLSLAGVVAATLLLPPRLFHDVFAERYGKVLMYREQVTDIVMVTDDGSGRWIRYGDGRGTAGTGTFRENRSYGHLAMLPHPDPKKVLQICFGVGNSLATVTRYPVERVDQVELSPGVIDAAPFFSSTNRNVLEDPRVHLTIQDGRNFLLTSPDRYDVILLEPPELHTAGVVNLYTKEFYEIARDHLASGGLLSMWVNAFLTPEPALKMVLRTMAEVFPHVTVWHGPSVTTWIINGSVEPRPPDLELLTRWFSDPGVQADLATIPIRTPFQLLNLFVMADEDVRDWTAGAAIITDDHTRVDFTVPRSSHSFFGVSNPITEYYLVNQMGGGVDWAEVAARYCDAKQPVWSQLVHVESSHLSPVQIRRRLSSQLGKLPFGCIGRAQRRFAQRMQPDE